jgi:tripeptide aminopeptidase
MKTKSKKNNAAETPVSLPAINEKRATDLVMELLNMPGLSGQEDQVQTLIRQKLREEGVPDNAIRTDTAHRRSMLGGIAGNLICVFPGTLPGPRRLLMAHLDTVRLCAGAQPLLEKGLVRSANPFSGLGADNRSGVAVILNAALEIKRRNLPHPPLTFFFPVQEEVGLFGVRHADVHMLGQPQLCFNWDSDEPGRLIIGSTGACRMHIEITGLASHAGLAPDKGVSAIVIAGTAIAALQAQGWHGLIVKGGKRGTGNIGVIQGGDATNVVTDHVSLKAEARSHDAKFRKQIVDAMRKAFEQAVKTVRSKEGKRGSLDFRVDNSYESFKLPPDNPSVMAAERVAKAAGLKPKMDVTDGGLDANWMHAHGLPTVSMGAGQRNVHTVNERMVMSDYLKGCQIALALATGR